MNERYESRISGRLDCRARLFFRRMHPVVRGCGRLFGRVRLFLGGHV